MGKKRRSRSQSAPAPGAPGAPPPAQPPAKKKVKKEKAKKEVPNEAATVANAGAWEEAGVPLSEAVLGTLKEDFKFSSMAPVQAAAIPQLLSGRDVIVQAVTGSGKTLAYLVPSFEMCLRGEAVQLIRESPQALVVLVILPTRELAIQVQGVATRLAEGVAARGAPRIAVNSFIGGRDVARDTASYAKTGGNMVVGTPGRLHEVLVLGGEVSCKHIEMLVLDEADRLLSQGFQMQLDSIMERIPKQRRTGLFSATQTREVKDLIRIRMRNPVMVSAKVRGGEAEGRGGAGETTTPTTLTNYYRLVRPSMKLSALYEFLLRLAAEEEGFKAIVYVLTCACVEYTNLALKKARGDQLAKHRIGIHPLHGQMPLQRRKKLFSEFKAASENAVLVCTDVAARGLDVPDVDWVIQLDAPTEPATFIHRVGRTARMGRKGRSLLYLAPSESCYVEYMKLQHIELKRMDHGDGYEEDSDGEANEDGGSDADAESDAAGEDEKAEGVQVNEDGIKVNPRGAVMFRLRAHNKGMQEKLKRRMKRVVKSGKGVDPVIIGTPCKSELVRDIRRVICTDRELMDVAAKAYVTWVRSYKEHALRYIFKMRKIDAIDLAHAFGLLRLPRMPELAHAARAMIPLEAEFRDVDPSKVEHADPEKEQKRQQKKELKRQREQEKLQERSERNKAREAIKKDTSLGARKKREVWAQLELDELNNDVRMMKKLRQGKITEEEYAKATGEDELDLAFLAPREKWKRRKEKERKEKEAAAPKAEQPAGSDGDGSDEDASMGDQSSDDAGPDPVKQLNLPAHVKTAPSGAPQSWINMIKKKIGKA